MANPDSMKDRPNKLAAKPELISNVLRTVASQRGEDADYFKVFSLGFNKTATTSIYSLFKSLGFEAMDGPHWRKNSQWHLHFQFQTFTDGPPEDFRFLDGSFPNSKFLLNIRRLDEWLDSRIEHVIFRMQSPGYKSRMSSGRVPDKDILMRWARERERHHQDVLEYFSARPNDLLVVNYIDDQDAPQKIANFVGKKWEGKDRPFTRSTPSIRERGVLKNRDLIYSALQELGVNESEFSADLLCSSW
jgi:hypothetical protein